MRQRVAKIILHLFGWKVENNLPVEVRKCVVIMAPHTSNWDFIIGWIGFASLGRKSKYLIKKEAFVFPFGKMMRALGAIPVDRSASTNVVLQVVERFKRSDELIITITPEGTRSLRHNWKRGYYNIATLAGVPIALGYLDYKLKKGGISIVFTPTGDYNADYEIIRDFYKNLNACHPEKFNLSKMYWDVQKLSENMQPNDI